MTEPIWLSVGDVLALHAEQLAIFGGPEGVRDRGLLESALGRPLNKWSYETGDMAEIAAAYAFGIAKNHPFIDGNKRAAFTAMIVWLRANGIPFAPDPAQATAAMMALASSEIDEAGLARWIGDNWPEGAPRSFGQHGRRGRPNEEPS